MTCEAGLGNWLLGTYTACTEPDAQAVIRICLHEHMSRVRVCAGHAERALSGNPRAVCRECVQLPGELAHRCPVTIVPDDQEAQP